MEFLSGARNKLAIVGVSGLMFTGAVVGLGSLASAETPEPVPADEVDHDEMDHDEMDHDEVSDFDGFPAEDQALIEQFERCLADAGIGEEGDHGDEAEWTEEDYEALDEVFERCEQILDDLSFDSEEWLEPGEGDFEDFDFDYGEFESGHFEYFEISPEDEALFERFEQCLTDGGLDEEAIDGEEAGTLTEDDYARLESVFEGCESILEDLSDGGPFFLEECPDGEDDHDHDPDEGQFEDDVQNGVQNGVNI